jgi:hypothetical protein
MACSIWEACHHQGTGWTEEIGNYCCYLRLVTALLAGYLKVYLFKLVLVGNPVCSSSMNVELHWLLYMVSRVFRGCIFLTIIHTGKTRLKSVTLLCTCHAVLSFNTYVYCDVTTTFFMVSSSTDDIYIPASILVVSSVMTPRTYVMQKTVWTDV